jgi:hypothetical protein
MVQWEEFLSLGTKQLTYKADQALRSKVAVRNELRGNSTTAFVFMASTKIALIFNVEDCEVSRAVRKKFGVISFTQKSGYSFL